MGLFDEESDSDDGGTPAAGPANGALHGGGDDDSEEDPLDAYMKSLGAAPAAPSSSRPGAGAGGGGGRMDVDAEDEATSHWEVTSSKGAASNDGKRLLPKHEWHDDGGAASSSTPSALTGFVRAGATKGEPGKQDGDAPDEDELDNIQSIRKRQHDMLHHEIDPLSKVDHKSVHYSRFRRQFYTPSDTPAGRTWRNEHEVTCAPSHFDPILGFGELDGIFPEELTRAIAKSGYEAPTLVQSQTLPVALGGNDALITAATGSGKTLAYIWPMIVHTNDQPHIHPGVDGPIGVVLTPTRELAKQVQGYAKTFVECIGGKSVEVAGGNKGTWELTKELKKGCEIVVSSPGRLIDMVKKKGTNLERVTFLVLDEADRMLDMGFEKQVSSILENVRPDRQTLLLSATFGKRVERVARGWLRNPVRIAIGRTGASSEHVDSHVMVLPGRDAKVQWLMEILPVLSPLGRCLVFVATRADCDHLSRLVQTSPSFAPGSSADAAAPAIVAIHGDKDQRDRNAAISQFKKNPRSILIATDVAARGLDIPGVQTVINFDPAKNMDAHVHRVGRAGRLSKDGNDHRRGAAYTLLTGRDANFAMSLAEAFEREGREVSPELAGLCQKSSRFGGGRAKRSKVGLGFGGDAASGAGAGPPQGSYYGPPAGAPPTKKKSRWG